MRRKAVAISTEQMKKILIIEDDPVAGTGYRNFLQSHGFQVEVVRDGATGLERLAEFAPDAVLLDLMIPKVNGIAVLKAIRAQEAYRHLPVLVLTSASIPILVEQALQAGANRVFDKANVKPLAVIGVFHDLLHTNWDPAMIAISKSGNPAAVLDF